MKVDQYAVERAACLAACGCFSCEAALARHSRRPGQIHFLDSRRTSPPNSRRLTGCDRIDSALSRVSDLVHEAFRLGGSGFDFSGQLRRLTALAGRLPLRPSITSLRLFITDCLDGCLDFAFDYAGAVVTDR